MITAVYNGNSNFLTIGPSFPLALSIAPGGTDTHTGVIGQSSSLRRADHLYGKCRSGAGGLVRPTGMVTFWDRTDLLGTARCASSGVATFSLTMPLAVGTSYHSQL